MSTLPQIVLLRFDDVGFVEDDATIAPLGGCREPRRCSRRLDTHGGHRMIASMAEPPRIVLSRFDHERLERLLDKVGSRPDLDALREEIDRAEIVEPEDVPSNLVTMNSTVRFRDEASAEESEVTLVFPRHADAENNRISVLAPIGSALLGLSVGDSIDWALPAGRTKRLRVIGIGYQPEAAGDTHL